MRDLAAPLGVIMVLPTYLPESFGGAEQQARKLSAALVGQGEAVTILSPRIKRQTPPFARQGVVVVRQFLVTHPAHLGGRYILSFLWWGLCIFAWLAWHRRSYRVIHIFHGRLHSVPAVISGWLLDRPTLVKIGRGGAEFDLDLVKRKFGYGRFFHRLLLRHATAFVANSREIAADLRRSGIADSQIFEIPNGVEIPEEPPMSGRENVFAYLGRLDPGKGIDRLIRAFAATDMKGYRLLIVGDGPSRLSLEQLARSCADLPIEFTGRLDDVAPVLRKARFFVSASMSEGMSNALLEAMSFGCIPIMSRASGSSDIVTDGVTGLLFDVGDDTGLKSCLFKAAQMNDEALAAMSKAARNRMQETFSITASAADHIHIYDKLAARD